MFRRTTLSILGGAVFALLLAFGQPTMAACLGYCADRIAGGGVFDSCVITLDRNGEAVSPPKCFYTSSKVVELDMVAEFSSE
jgi:hypothetical protein